MYEGPVFDADNHYYEALDAFTRHLDPKLGPPRACSGAEIDGRKYHVVGGKVSRAVDEPHVRPGRQGRRACTTTSAATPTGDNPLELPRPTASRSGPSTATATPASRTHGRARPRRASGCSRRSA